MYADLDYNSDEIYVDLSDFLSEEELEEDYLEKIELECHSPISMESLGLSWSDFL